MDFPPLKAISNWQSLPHNPDERKILFLMYLFPLGTHPKCFSDSNEEARKQSNLIKRNSIMTPNVTKV